MLYAHILDNTTKYPYSVEQFRVDNPNISLPVEPSQAQLEEFGLFQVKSTPIPGTTLEENFVEVAPEFVDGVLQQKWEVVPASQTEINNRKSSIIQHNKQTAMNLLTESDWVELPTVLDTNAEKHLVNVGEWNIYRSQLRSIAINTPLDIPTWPSKPEEIWSQ